MTATATNPGQATGAQGAGLPTGRSLFARFGQQLALLALVIAGLIALAPSARAADDFLEPEQAFHTSLVSADAHTIVLRATAAEGYYLYRARFDVGSGDPKVRLGRPVLPRGHEKYDPNQGGKVETYRGSVDLRVPVLAAPEKFAVRLALQGCADAGLCYSPMQAEFPVTIAGGVTTDVGSPPGKAAPKTVAAAGVASNSAPSELARIQRTLASGSLLTVASAFLALGLLLSFTPCVLPMVPILSSIIVGQQQPTSRSRGFALALAYSLGMALVYTSVGVAAGLAGEGLAAALQKPWVLALFASLLVALALSMFDLYHLQMPGFIQGRANDLANRLPGGRFLGVFAMGAASALVVGPCVAAPLAGALVYISQTRDVVLGGLALFSMAIGMSVPLLAIGASAGSLIPRAGIWMVAVKRFFGVLLIGVAIWLVSPAIPVSVQMLAWAVLLIISATYLSVFDPLPAQAGGWQRLCKGVGMLMLMAGTLQIVGAASGSEQVLQPLEKLAVRGTIGGMPADAGPRFETVRTLAELEQRIAAAGRPAMVDFSAAWCVSCKEMESITFADPRVNARMKDLVLLRVDVTENAEADKALLKRFGLFGPPGILLFGPDGHEREDARVIGFVPPDRFLEHLDRVTGI